MKYYEDIRHGFLLAYEKASEFFVRYVPGTGEWEDCNISFLDFVHDYEFREISEEMMLQKTGGSSPDEALKSYLNIIKSNREL